MSRRLRGAVAVVAATLALAGCGVPDQLVGLHAAPPQQTTAAALTPSMALGIATRVLDAATAAEHETGAQAAADQQAVLTGAALAVAKAATATKTTPSPTASPLSKPGAPQLVAISKGTAWPRAMIVTTLDASDKRQYLYALVSSGPTAPFLLAAAVPMHGGASVPALGAVAAGAALVQPGDGSGMAASPADVLAQYAAALDQPKPTPTSIVSTTDAFANALRSNAAAEVKTLGKLGSLTQKHVVVPADTIAFRLSDGGAVVFGMLTRTDTLTLAKNAKEFVLPPAYAALTGKKKAQGITATTLEPLVVVIPPSGMSVVVGADEQVVSVTAG